MVCKGFRKTASFLRSSSRVQGRKDCLPSFCSQKALEHIFRSRRLQIQGFSGNRRERQGDLKVEGGVQSQGNENFTLRLFLAADLTCLMGKKRKLALQMMESLSSNLQKEKLPLKSQQKLFLNYQASQAL